MYTWCKTIRHALVLIVEEGKEVLNVAKPIIPTLVISDFFDQDRPLIFVAQSS